MVEVYKMNIAIVSSQGGHSGQMKLIFSEEVLGKNNLIFITESPDKIEFKKKYFQNKYDSYFFEKDVLLKMNPFKYLSTVFKLIKIFRKNKINLLITNGAQLSIPAVIAAKLIGIKIVFIETIIRVKTTTWTAKFCYYFANIFLVQHPEMIVKYGRKAKYVGGIL